MHIQTVLFLTSSVNKLILLVCLLLIVNRDDERHFSLSLPTPYS